VQENEEDVTLLTQSIRAALFDVDGTLYNENILKYFMRLELCTLPFRMNSLRAAYKVWRSLQCFRHIREDLRKLEATDNSLAVLQYIEVARQTGEDPAQIEKVVNEWIYQRPLKYLRICRRNGLNTFLAFLESRGLRIGVLSDYPVVDKLVALDLEGRMSLTLCSLDPAINAFKPHPKGFLHACEIWQLPPAQVLYIGDRPVDALGAANAGMPFALVGVTHGKKDEDALTFPSFANLQRAITPYC